MRQSSWSNAHHYTPYIYIIISTTFFICITKTITPFALITDMEAVDPVTSEQLELSEIKWKLFSGKHAFIVKHSQWKSTSFKMCLLKKTSVYKSVCVTFILKTNPTDAAFPACTYSSCTGSLSLRNQPPAMGCIGLYFIFSIRKVRGVGGRGKWKQGASAVDISVCMMAASFRHHNRAPAAAVKRTSTAFSQYISSSVESLS